MLTLAMLAIAGELASGGSATGGPPLQAQVEQVPSRAGSFEQIGSVGRSSDEELVRLRERSALSQSLAEGSAAYDAVMPDPRLVALCEQAARLDMDPPEDINCVAVLEVVRQSASSSIEEQLLSIIRPSGGAAPRGGQAIRGSFDANDVARRLSTGDVRSSTGMDAAGAIGQQVGTLPPRGN
jgi:hypothetical protein